MNKKETYSMCVRKILLEFRDTGKDHITLDELKERIQEEITLPDGYLKTTGEFSRNVLKPATEMMKKEWPDFMMAPVEHGRQKVTTYEFHFTKEKVASSMTKIRMSQRIPKINDEQFHGGKLCFSISMEDFKAIISCTKVGYAKGSDSSTKRWVTIGGNGSMLRASSCYYQETAPTEYERYAFIKIPYSQPSFQVILRKRPII